MDCSAQNMAKAKCNQNTNQNIQVYVRVRPLNHRERAMRSTEIIEVSQPKEIIVRHSLDSKMTKKFTFDRAFGQDSKQSEVYQTVVAPLIEQVLAGYNCTVFAYGQTGTGKTHTMVGTECAEIQSSWEDESLIGIIPRALCHLLDELRLLALEHTMRISYLELYNEELCDLLSTDDTVKIRIYDDSTKKGSVIIQGLEEVIVHSKDDVYKLLEKGKERRKTATTLMNAQSSRSHTVFSIVVHIKESGIDGEEMLKIGKLNLVDLAGSENISKAGNEKGIRTRETVNINQSLLTLGRVITSLVERTPHIPYRESKLTRLLQESLGGRTKTSIIATISPGHKDVEETLSTLDYAHRAKNIQNRPEINQKLTKKTVLKEYTEEIDKLKRDLNAARDKNGIYLAEDTYNDLHYKLESQNKELNEKMLMIKALKNEMAKKELIFNEVSLNLVEKSEKLIKTERVLNDAKNVLNQTKKVLNTTKKRYKEKKILLNTHIKTEEKLSDQANQLIKVADIATDDHFRLQETLERRKDVDEKIQTVAEKFQNKMRNCYDDMNKDLEQLNDKHNSFWHIINNEVNDNNKIVNKSINNAKIKINEITVCYEDSANQFNSNFETSFEDILQINGNYKIVFKEIIEKQKEREIEWKGLMDKCFNEMKNVMNDQISIQEKSHELISKLSSENNKKEIEFFSKVKEHLNIVSQTAQALIEEERKTVTSNVQKSVEQYQKKQGIVSQMEQLLENLKNAEEEEHARNMSLETVSSNLLSVKNDIASKISKEVNSIEDFSVVKDNSLTEIQTHFDTIDKDQNTLLNKIGRDVKTLETYANDQFINRNDFQNKIEEKYNEGIERISNSLDNHKKILLEKKNNSIIAMKTNSIEANNILFQVASNINNHAVQNLSYTKSLQTTVDDYNVEYNKKMRDNYAYLESFYQNELKTYTPTGQTPSKKEFSYPKVLTQTSPHDIIIKRFRLENDYSDLDISNTTISEDNESTMLDLLDETPVRSTPIRLDKSEQIYNSNENTLRDSQSLNVCENTNISELQKKSSSISVKRSPSPFNENKENTI